MDTVYYKGKKYSGIKVPESSEVKLYSLDGRYKGRYIETVQEKDLKREKVQNNSH